MTQGFGGAVDLAALAAQRQRAEQAGGGVVELTEANVADVLQDTARVPLFVLFVSAHAPQCAELLGRWKAVLDGTGLPLATVDVDLEVGLAQAFQVQAVPAGMAVLAGRPVPLFQGSPDDAQLAQLIAQVLQVAKQAGMPVGDVPGAPEELEEPEDPLDIEADEALAREDFDGALAVYERALKENPRNAKAREGKARVALIARLAAGPAGQGDAIASALAAADNAIFEDRVAEAFAGLLDLMASLPPAEREPVRLRLIELFDVVGTQDPAVIDARKRLASLLN